MSRPSRSAASASSHSASGSSRKRTRPDRSTSSGNPRRRAAFGASPFTDFGSYMSEKNRKLRDQFDASASTSSLGSGGRNSAAGSAGGGGGGIFSGVSIFVDGFTVPSSQELKGYMMRHGGRFENYFSRHRVTHIICSNLPDSKIKNIRTFSRGLPVVTPTWVLDSVAANKLLSWVPYQLSELVNETAKQQKLSAFFTLKRISNPKDAVAPLDPDMKFHAECSLSKDEESDNSFSPVEYEDHENMKQATEESSRSEFDGISESSIKEKTTNMEDEHITVEPISPSPDRISDMDHSTCAGKSVDNKFHGTSNQHHSTLSDPNFVENYFKASFYWNLEKPVSEALF